MPGLYKVTLLPEGKVHSLSGTRGNYYQLPGGQTLTVRAIPIWCRQCQAFSEGENIKSVEELERDVADCSDVNSAQSRRILDSRYFRDKSGILAKRLAESRTRLEWRQDRSALPKCLACGTTDVMDLGDGQEIVSPCSLGTLTIAWVGMCSTAFRNYYYTPEGDRIPMETRPSRWHMTR